jgi:hypothetical protein
VFVSEHFKKTFKNLNGAKNVLPRRKTFKVNFRKLAAAA